MSSINLRKPLVIDLLRHGFSVANAAGRYSNIVDEPLDPSAYADLTRLNKILDDFKYDRAYSSPYQRCLETAKFLVGDRGLKIEQIAAIREMAHGPWDGLRPQDIARIYPQEWQTWRECPDRLTLPGRETLQEVQDRALPWFKGLVEEAEETRVLVVTHEVVMRVILANFLEIPLSRVRQAIKIGNLKIYRLDFAQASPLIWELHIPCPR